VNIFANIEKLHDFSFRKVRYYTVRLQDSEVNEFFDFLNRMEDIEEYEEDLNNLVLWLEEIGEKYGADTQRFFRNESINADVYAVPPPLKTMKYYDIQVRDLRLYCLVANKNVVFLLNGGIKTNGIVNAKDCPNVGPYIKQANTIAKALFECFKDKSIKWNADQSDISFDHNLEIEL
jgi:hypothetical protein